MEIVYLMAVIQELEFDTPEARTFLHIRQDYGGKWLLSLLGGRRNMLVGLEHRLGIYMAG